jgi:hypothetical protein
VNEYVHEHLADLVKCQAQARMRLHRKKYLAHKCSAVKVQSAWKDYKQKKEYADAVSKTPAVVKIQAWWRGAKAKYEYKQLRYAHGAEVKIVKQYLTLFDSQDDEIEEETALHSLRENVIQKIRDNLAAENELNELDSKVALLIKNRITLDEVSHFKSKDMRAALAKSAQTEKDEVTVFNLRGKDKETQSKKKRYEELFYVLQTKPVYLAALMYSINRKIGQGGIKFLEQAVLTLFGYAQNTREEYLFLKLIEVNL